jgi:glycine cleavage system aminomethyltransferase T
MMPPNIDLHPTRSDVLRRLVEILLEDVRVKLSRDQLEEGIALFGTGIGLDSIDGMELFVAITRRFGVSMDESPRLREAMRTLDGLADYIVEALAGPTALDAASDAPPGATPLHAADEVRTEIFDRRLRLDGSERSEEFAAVRRRVAISTLRRVVLKMSGGGAFDWLDAVSSRDLFVRSGGSLPIYLMTESGDVLADVLVCARGRDFWLLCDGASSDEIADYLHQHRPLGVDAELVDLSLSHGVMEICGPFAWEVMDRLHDGAYVGLPFLSHAAIEGCDGIVIRATRVGEHGYVLVFPSPMRGVLEAELQHAAVGLDARRVSEEVLETCAVEAGVPVASLDAFRGRNPISLRQSWRVGFHRTAPGVDALTTRRHGEVEPRATWLLSVSTLPLEIPRCSAVTVLGSDVGTTWLARRSGSRGRTLVVAGIDPRWAIRGLLVQVLDHDFVVTSPPVVASASVHVDPRRHSYSTRLADGLADLA